MLIGSNLVHTKQYNLRIVHEVIRLFGPLSRAQIARHTALTGQTVSNLVRELIELDLVQEAGRRKDGGRGAPAATLRLNPDGAYSIGLDFNRDHLTGVLIDLAGTVRQRASIELELPPPERAIDLMARMVDSLLAQQRLPRERVCGVGVGVPGPMSPATGERGYVVNPKAFPGWHEVPLADLLRERVGLPVLLEKNATAAAAGERWYGAGRQIGTFFYLFFGSGLGGGLVTNGRPYEGATGNAGEVGYLAMSLDEGEDASHVGVHFNLPRLFEELRREGLDARTPSDLDALLGEGHPRIVAWFDAAVSYVVGIVLSVEYLIDPEAIFFGGRLPERLLECLRERVAQQLPSRRIGGKSAAPRLLLATAGSDAAALGVATLPIYELFAPAPQVLLKQRRRRLGGGPLAPRAVAP